MFIKRTIFDEIKAHLEEKEITLIVGPRQAGKTTLMLRLQNELNQRGEKTVFLNLDIESDKRFFKSQADLVNKIQLEIGSQKGYVFIDEIQRKENAGLFLKGIFDMGLPYKLIVSGSGSLELKEKIHESLAGRKRVFETTTLSFEEFAHFKTEYRYEEKLFDFFSLEKEKTAILLNEYLNFGGYPKVVLADRADEKRKAIDEIFQSYIEKDISYLLGVKNTDAFANLVKVLASQAGNLTNISELSLTLGISAATVKQYLWYLEKTFILERIAPYFKNIRKEITKSPVVYFYDLGLRNYAIGSMGSISDQQAGFLFQNMIHHMIKERLRFSASRMYFWRTKDGAEVDFIVDDGKTVTPIEVKYSDFMEPTIPKSFKSYISKYHPSQAYVLTSQFEAEASWENTKVLFVPFYKARSILPKN